MFGEGLHRLWITYWKLYYYIKSDLLVSKLNCLEKIAWFWLVTKFLDWKIKHNPQTAKIKYPSQIRYKKWEKHPMGHITQIGYNMAF